MNKRYATATATATAFNYFNYYNYYNYYNYFIYLNCHQPSPKRLLLAKSNSPRILGAPTHLFARLRHFACSTPARQNVRVAAAAVQRQVEMPSS
ncbi:MAG: hypothetical protein J7639_32530 [Paenibacillaceae bacterium]|nr:hypothetical protein [Paenibacillaceae bacterium]